MQKKNISTFTKKFMCFCSMSNFMSYGQNLSPVYIMDIDLGKNIFIQFVTK